MLIAKVRCSQLSIIMTEVTSYFTPQWVSPPGDTIQDVIEERDWTLAQLSEALGYSPQFINQLLNGGLFP